MNESSSSLTIQDSTHTHTHTSPPSKAKNEFPQSEEGEIDPEATSAQAVETAMDTSVEAESTSKDDDDRGQGSSSKMEKTAATPPPTKPSSSEEKKRDKNSPFLYSSVLYALVYCRNTALLVIQLSLPKYAKFHNYNSCAGLSLLSIL